MQVVNHGTLAERILSLKEPGETQEAFGERAGIKQASVHDWLNGVVKTPKRSTVEIVARNLNVHPEWLRSGKGPRRPYPLRDGTPAREQMRDNLAFAKHLDQIGDVTARYDTLAQELEALIRDCDERKSRYQAMLAKIHQAVEREIDQTTRSKR